MVRKKVSEQDIDRLFELFNEWKDVAAIASDLSVSKEFVRSRIRAVYSSTYRRKY